ncbi:MAG TPA: hypothetical protein VEA37_13870 [Flavobacterium sp.]|nr:hypothetical protein [Flavobacterium sp.]
METLSNRIKQEETQDIVNIHNFLLSVINSGETNNILELYGKLHLELTDRPEASNYLHQVKSLLLK